MPDIIGHQPSPPSSLPPVSASPTSSNVALSPLVATGGSTTHLPAPPEVESTIQRLSSHKNVRGVIIMSRDGVVIRSTGPVLQGSDGVLVLRRYASEVRKMVEAVGSAIGGMELDDQLRFLRIRTRQHELLITPDSKFTLVVIQDPTKCPPPPPQLAQPIQAITAGSQKMSESHMSNFLNMPEDPFQTPSVWRS